MITCADVNIKLCSVCKFTIHIGPSSKHSNHTIPCWLTIFANLGDKWQDDAWFRGVVRAAITGYDRESMFYFYNAIKHYHPELLLTLDKLMVLQ